MIEEAIFDRSTTFAGLTALIETRCYPNLLPEQCGYPAISYRLISDPEIAMTHDGGPSGLSRERWQFDCWAETEAEARDVAEQVRLCWEGFRGTVAGVSIGSSLKAGGGQAGRDAGTNLHRRTRDFFITYSQSTS